MNRYLDMPIAKGKLTGKSVQFGLLYALATWIAGGLDVALVVPLIARSPEQTGALGSLASLVVLVVAIPAAVIGFSQHRK